MMAGQFQGGGLGIIERREGKALSVRVWAGFVIMEVRYLCSCFWISKSIAMNSWIT